MSIELDRRRGKCLTTFANTRLIGVLLVCVACVSCGGGGSENAPGTVASAPPGSAPPQPVPPSPSPGSPPSVPAPPPAPNRTPVLTKPIADQRAAGGRPFTFDVSQAGTTFTDPDGDQLTYVVTTLGRLDAAGPRLTGMLPAEGVIEVQAHVTDGHSHSAELRFKIVAVSNAAPIVSSPNLAIMTTAGARIHFDATKSGTTFTDAENDPLTYELNLVSPPLGLSVSGTQVVGELTDVGAVTFELTATDVLGAKGTDRFSIAVAAPEPGAPVLPATSYIYADAELSLPVKFATTHLNPPGDFGDPGQANNPATNAGATLGRVLFYDKRLSITNTHACGSCHHQANGFAENRRFPVGVQGVPLKRQAMALSNVRFNQKGLWFTDLRAGSLEELVLMPIQEPSELGNYLPVLEQKLAGTSFYPALFEAAFGTREITSDRIARALGQFLRSLTSYRSPYDTAFSGTLYRDDLLTPLQRRGLELFNGSGAGCAGCHFTSVQQMWGAKSNGLDAELTDPGFIGPLGATGMFRSPSLRNIAASAPYMHDGRFATLREVIDHYDHGMQASPLLDWALRDSNGVPKRLNLSEDDKLALEALLRSLTDDAFLNDPKFADPFL